MSAPDASPPAGSARSPRRVRAFTLIEILTVIAIVAVLTGIVLGVGRRAAESARIARAKGELAALSAALEGYKRQYGEYPRTASAAVLLQSLAGRLGPTQSSLSGRSRLDLASFSIRNGADPLSDATALLIDPWDQPYVYAYKTPAGDWTNPGFVLYSIGPDGKDDPALEQGSPRRGATENADNLYANE